ncbi:lysozyme C, milk isozyme-like [Eublepharis macularius]|uniref:Lysozyme C, milk isozyme-like n=1 Tax=Eublepharis macularius TaxID=481883 RepID=A0AA97LM46_EUBMA|nr:lysozyme C, milk isozyme-like [Eublepharis macularius]
MKNQGFVAFLLLLISVNEAKRLDRCELTWFLKKGDMDGYYGTTIGDWICLAFYGSRFNTKSLGGRNPDGGRNYGIFQINSRWWCSTQKGRKSNGCNAYCGDFIDDDIRDDIACVKIIAREASGLDAWYLWRRNCKGKNLSRWTRGCEF